MSDLEQPQIYLITPSSFELSSFSNQLNEVLDACDIACLRLSLSTRDEDRILRAGDMVREITHSRDIALVIDSHIRMVERLGLDGVHLPDGARNLRKTREDLGPDAIIGAHCGQSRHEGMNAGESGADYVCFGPVGKSDLGDGEVAEPDLFKWWSEMIEVPVVAEGDIGDEDFRNLASVTDFFALGDEVWLADNPAERLREIQEIIRSGL